jgi:hypothetical protein
MGYETATVMKNVMLSICTGKKGLHSKFSTRTHDKKQYTRQPKSLLILDKDINIENSSFI